MSMISLNENLINTNEGTVAEANRLGFSVAQVTEYLRILTPGVLIDIDEYMQADAPFGAVYSCAGYQLNNGPKGLFVGKDGTLIGFIPVDDSGNLLQKCRVPKGYGNYLQLHMALLKIARSELVRVFQY